MDRAKELILESQHEMLALPVKASVGAAGSFTAMTVNDVAGLCVAILTGIYMLFQIESAWRKRRLAIEREKRELEARNNP